MAMHAGALALAPGPADGAARPATHRAVTNLRHDKARFDKKPGGEEKQRPTPNHLAPAHLAGGKRGWDEMNEQSVANEQADGVRTSSETSTRPARAAVACDLEAVILRPMLTDCL